MRILCSVVQSFVLSMLHEPEHLLFRRCVTFELIGDDDPGREALLFEQFAEKSLCCVGIKLS